MKAGMKAILKQCITCLLRMLMNPWYSECTQNSLKLERNVLFLLNTSMYNCLFKDHPDYEVVLFSYTEKIKRYPIFQQKSTLPHIFPFHNKEVKYHERRDANESVNFSRRKQAAQHSHPGPAISCS